VYEGKHVPSSGKQEKPRGKTSGKRRAIGSRKIPYEEKGKKKDPKQKDCSQYTVKTRKEKDQKSNGKLIILDLQKEETTKRTKSA